MASIDFSTLWAEPLGKGLGRTVVPYERYCYMIQYSYNDDNDALTCILEYLPTLLESDDCAGALLRGMGLPEILVDMLESAQYPHDLKVDVCVAIIHLVCNHDRCTSTFVGMIENTDGVLEKAFQRLARGDGVEEATAFLHFIEMRGEEVLEEESDSV